MDVVVCCCGWSECSGSLQVHVRFYWVELGCCDGHDCERWCLWVVVTFFWVVVGRCGWFDGGSE